MLWFLVRRIVAAVPILIFVAVFIFMLLHLAPGDPAAVAAGPNASPQQVELLRQRMQLDMPLPDQFMRWVANLARFDLGVSIFSNQPVSRLIGQRLEPTLLLAVTAMLVAVAIAVPAGTLAAWKADSLLDRVVMMFAVAGFSTPVFVTAYGLIYVFSIELGWFPVQGYTPLAQGILDCLQGLVLPSLALGFVFAALIARVVRATMLEILAEDYIRTARAKGLATPTIVVVHALKNAGVPTMTVIGIGFAILVGGVVVTETIFNIPGLGRLTTDAIHRRDYPVVQGVILAFSAMLIVVNILVDLSYALFDPRVRNA
ncbi:MAG: ABC transporter permease [Ferrovibrionaceae bacterium]